VCWNETQSLPKGTVPSHLLSFHAQKFGHDYGLLAWKAVTDAITDAVPEATVGANMSPAYSGCPPILPIGFWRLFRVPSGFGRPIALLLGPKQSYSLSIHNISWPMDVRLFGHPNHECRYSYQFIRAFREGAMNMPWGEDSHGWYCHLDALIIFHWSCFIRNIMRGRV
jgi:hypothetical protein